jgi:hypothetical protein
MVLLWGCENTTSTKEEPGPEQTKTGDITFFNVSSYVVTVHQDVFSGVVLLTLSSGQRKKITVPISDNYGNGSTFPVEYAYKVAGGSDIACGEVWAEHGIDPNIQITVVVEADKSYTKEIPQPHELDADFTAAFVRLVNASDLQIELNYLGQQFQQTGTNKVIPIPNGETGVYKFTSIPREGKLYSGYTLTSNFNSVPFPEFTAKPGYIYDFTYNGIGIVKTQEKNINF